ncbi:MAG TPA: glycosyltransferase family 2 protein [Methanolinea sp.]|nr:glycosyltransferase family 2 protein [Methanolinea sp.]
MTSFPYSASIIIPNWNGMNWLPGCLAALKDQTVQDFEIIVVDNGSSDGSVPYIQSRYPAVRIITFRKNCGFSKAVNEGIKKASGKYIVLLNNDTLPEKEWLISLLNEIRAAPIEVGSLASLMIRMDNPSLTDDAGDYLDWYGLAFKRGNGEPIFQWIENEPVFSACAGAVLYRREFLERTGLFDEKFWSYLEDVDLGLRGNLLGFTCIFVPSARVLHKSHGSAMPSGAYVYHVTKNRVMLLLKNIPSILLAQNARTLISGQILTLRINKNPSSSIRAYLYIVFLLPKILHDRRCFLPRVVLSIDAINTLLRKTGNQ